MKPALDTSLRLSPSQFYPEHGGKSLIVLHHTVGGSARSTFRWWEREDPRRIGTAYIVERDGTIYEVFPPSCWAWHLGVKDDEIERRSIGIELASEGALLDMNEGDGLHVYAFDGQKDLGHAWTLEAAGRAVRFERRWRGYRWFDPYDPEQIEATCKLVAWLCLEFGIPGNIPEQHELFGEADLKKWFAYAGVLHHAMLRPDKSDLHPGFPFDRLREALSDGRR